MDVATDEDPQVIVEDDAPIAPDGEIEPMTPESPLEINDEPVPSLESLESLEPLEPLEPLKPIEPIEPIESIEPITSIISDQPTESAQIIVSDQDNKEANVPKVRIVPGTPQTGSRPHSAFYYNEPTQEAVEDDESHRPVTRSRLDTKESTCTLPPISSANSRRTRPSTGSNEPGYDISPPSSLMSFSRSGQGSQLASSGKTPEEERSLSSAKLESENMSPFEEYGANIPKELARIKRNQLIGASGETSWIDQVGVRQIFSRASLEVKGNSPVPARMSAAAVNVDQLRAGRVKMEIDGNVLTIVSTKGSNPNAVGSSMASPANSSTASKLMIATAAATSPAPAMPPPTLALQGSVTFRQCLWDACYLRCYQTVDMLMRHVINEHVVNDSNEQQPQQQQQIDPTAADGTQQPVSNPRRKIFVCKWADCSRRGIPFTARYKLVNHLRTHTGEKPVRCSFAGCDKAFTSSESLKIHMTSHTGERPYPCDACDKMFSNRSDRSRHRRTHSDRTPFWCNYPGCDKRYTDPSSLRKHIKGHNNQIGAPMMSRAATNLNLSTTALAMTTGDSSFSPLGNNSNFNSSSTTLTPPASVLSPSSRDSLVGCLTVQSFFQQQQQQPSQQQHHQQPQHHQPHQHPQPAHHHHFQPLMLSALPPSLALSSSSLLMMSPHYYNAQPPHPHQNAAAATSHLNKQPAPLLILENAMTHF